MSLLQEQNRREKSKMCLQARGQALFKLADLLEQHTDEIAALETLENGKPYGVAQLVNRLAIKYLRSHAGTILF